MNLIEFENEWIEEPRADTVKRMRERTGWGMMDCKAYLQKAAFMRELDAADTIEKLRDLAKIMANNMNWRLK